jgi:hypothetical protein
MLRHATKKGYTLKPKVVPVKKKLPIHLRLPLAIFMSIIGTACYIMLFTGMLLGFVWSIWIILAGTVGNPFWLGLGTVEQVNLTIYILAAVAGVACGVGLGIMVFVKGGLGQLYSRPTQTEQSKQRQLRKSISRQEALTRKDPDAPAHWSRLATLYDRAGSYKDMENALKMSMMATRAMFPEMEWAGWSDRRILGKAYLAALANSIRGRGISIWSWGGPPSGVTPTSLGYTAVEVRSLAEETLRTSYKLATDAGFDEHEPLLQKIKLAIEATVNISDSALDAYDKFNPNT